MIAHLTQGSLFSCLMDLYDPNHRFLYLFQNVAIDINGLFRIWGILVLLSTIYTLFVGNVIATDTNRYFLYPV